MLSHELATTIKALVVEGKGILAADESTGTLEKRFKNVNLTNSETMRRDYRELLFTTPQLSNFISGVILYEETLSQSTRNGQPFVEMLTKQGIVPGIKVDKGIIPLALAREETITQGLDGLAERLINFKLQGARFAKWRAVIKISSDLPSCYAVHANAEALARYAAICQEQGIVPIVEPELLMDGNHTLERCAQATEQTLHTVFNALYQYRVKLEYIILKPSMVIAGNEQTHPASIEQVADTTIQVLKRTVPAAVPSINFLSGGQTDELSTAHLNAMNKNNPHLPWLLSFSYGRALQAAALKTWLGQEANLHAAQQALLKRARLNSFATKGQYSSEME